MIGAGLAVVVLIGIVAATLTRPAPPAAIPVPVTTERLVARGQVKPADQARVGTLAGGVVRELLVEPGDVVTEGQPLARIRGAETIEVLSAPRPGTVTDVLVHVGDTVTPGTMVASIGTLSRLQVETTDVDEFVVGRIQRSQPVTLTVEALDRLELKGVVRSVALEPRTTTAGDEHYPVVIDLAGWPPNLRPGMTTRITFEP
jgi:multidrug efflux pump subunit AcrA (membrane-fusion protein)